MCKIIEKPSLKYQNYEDRHTYGQDSLVSYGLSFFDTIQKFQFTNTWDAINKHNQTRSILNHRKVIKINIKKIVFPLKLT